MDVIFVTFVIAANLALPILVTGLVNHTIKKLVAIQGAWVIICS